MNFKTMMGNLIEEEIAKIEQNGEKVKLKTLVKKRIVYTLILGAIFAALIVANNLFLAFVDLVIYFILMYNTNNVSVITKLAKQAPDTPISDIIRGDMRL